MKTTMLIATLILSFQTMANDSELKNRMQMVCIGSSEKGNIIVLTQVDPEVESGLDLFNYNPTGNFEINNVKLVLEIYEPQNNEKENNEKENIEKMDEEQLRSKILEPKFAKRLARFDGHGSRMERFFNFQDKETKSNQLRINLDNIKNVGYAYSEYSDGFECRKAYETTYSPFDDPKPEMEDKNGTIQLAEIQDGDSCVVGVDKECVEGAPIPQVRRFVCQGMRFKELIDEVMIISQIEPGTSKLINNKEFERTDISVLFKLQMMSGQVDFTTKETVASSSEELLRNTPLNKIREVEVVGSRYINLLKFEKSDSPDEKHLFEMDLINDYNYYTGPFTNFGLRFQCAESFNVDFIEP